MKNIYEAEYRMRNSTYGGETRSIIASTFDQAVAKAKKLHPIIQRQYSFRLDLVGVKLCEIDAV